MIKALKYFILVFTCIVLYSDDAAANNLLECSYKHQYYSWTKITLVKDPITKKPEERKDWHYMDYLFTLYCYDQVATVLYEKHVLDKFKVKSCNFIDFENDILLPKTKDDSAVLDERELPTSMNIYYIQNGKCYAKKYTFKNYEDGQKEAGQIERAAPIKMRCSREAGLDGPMDSSDGTYFKGSKHYDLDVFGNCKTWKGLFYNVNNIKWTATEWFPATLRLDPPGLRTDTDTPHTKLLSCTYQTGDYLFRLLCIKLNGFPNYLAYVGEHNYGVDIERFNVLSCHEEQIVNSIFPPNYSTKQPDKGPVHTFMYAYYTGKCMQRSYTCGGSGQILGAQAEAITCPSWSDLTSSSGSLGRWGNCEGPLKSPPVIDLTVN